MLEICVDTIDGALAAQRGGASRVELCSSLSEGGLTPSCGLMAAAAHLSIDCYAMIRPRSGLFDFSDREVEIMLADIATARDLGLSGVVLGVQSSDGSLDTEVLRRLTDAAGAMGKTLHRIIDVVPDPLAALETAASLGFDRVLTSGAQPFAPEGTDLIGKMVKQAAGRLSIMPGSGLTPQNVADVLRKTGATEVHAACRIPVAGDPAFSDFDPPGGRYHTSETEVRKMVSALMS